MKTKLKYYPEEVLSTPCKDVANFADIGVLLDEMRAVMEQEAGLGLAANQIGHSLRICLMKSRGEIIEIINPRVIEESGEQFEEEGCLSFKSLSTKIKRPWEIFFSYQDRNGEEKNAIVYGKEAQCLSHELDHLNGKTILDYTNRAEKKRILKQLEKLLK